MIAKRITSKAAKPRMARLVRYVVAAEGGLDPRSWQRTADYMLCSKTNNRGEKVGGVRVTNCHTDDPAAATTLIEVTQAANTRSKTDKTYHLVFSFPPGEQPSLEVLHKIEDELCAAIGYAEHQRISAVHIDTDHLHVHVAINKVHPKGFQNIEPYYDKKKLMETCERLEIEYGLIRTNHGLTGQKPKAKVKDKQAQAEAHSGIETLTGHVTREIAPRLKEAKSWEEARKILSEHGLEIKQRGAGLVIGSGKLWVKASQCDRALSFKAMTDRLGPIDKEQEQMKPTKQFEPKPRQQHPSSAVLFEQYQSEILKYRKARENGLEQINYKAALMDVQVRKWRVAQRLIVKAAATGPKRRAMLKMVKLQTESARRLNRAAAEATRNELLSETMQPSWIDWLARQAEHGNTEALAVLRSRHAKTVKRGDFVTARNTSGAKNVLVDTMRFDVDKKGHVTYRWHDGGVVVDRGDHVQCLVNSANSMRFSLDLAVSKFGKQTLLVEGQAGFQQDVAWIANEKKIKVILAKPAPPREQFNKRTVEKGIEL